MKIKADPPTEAEEKKDQSKDENKVKKKKKKKMEERPPDDQLDPEYLLQLEQKRKLKEAKQAAKASLIIDYLQVCVSTYHKQPTDA